MHRSLLLLSVGMALGIGGAAIAFQHKDGEAVKLIGTHELKEKLDGKETKATVVEVTIGPGEEGTPHRHPGPALVYVLEGDYELGIDELPTKIYHAGETFYEPAGCLHRVSKNPSSKGKTRLIACVLHPKDAKEIAIPEHAK